MQIRSFLLPFSLWIATNSPMQAIPVQIRVMDGETAARVPARAYLTCDGESVLPANLPSYRRGAEEHFLLSGEDVFELRGDQCQLRVERGLEYHPSVVNFEPAKSPAVEVRLSRWAWMNRDGWYSADMHVHRDPKEMGKILLAEDLNFGPAITYHVWSEQVSRPFESASSFPVEVDATHFYTANSQEVERIQGGPGAVILLARELPIPFNGTEFYPPNVLYTRQAHSQGGYVEGDKLFWLDTPVNVALGEIDFIELNCNHFLPHDVDTDLPLWSHWPVEFGYFGDPAFALWMMDLYYRYLNSGFQLPLSAGSASGVKATPVGYDRVYVFLGERELTYDSFMEALKEGRSFTTNGPIVHFEVNGGLGPGSETALKRGETVRLSGVARSRSALQQVQLVINGQVHKSYAGDGKAEIRIEEEIPFAESSWVALRAFEDAEETVVFAHTSPAYLLIDSRPVRVKADAAVLRDQVQRLIDYTTTQGVFDNPEHLQETVALYREAWQIYSKIVSGDGK